MSGVLQCGFTEVDMLLQLREGRAALAEIKMLQSQETDLQRYVNESLHYDLKAAKKTCDIVERVHNQRYNGQR